MAQGQPLGVLASLSLELAGVVERAAPSVVRVDDGSRLTATGVVWTTDGLILTTSHGVERDEDLAVEFADESRLPATVVGRDLETDIALLRVQATNVIPVPLASPEDVKVGHLTLALGRPGESGLQATLGLISARHEAQDDGRPEYILHTDATLFPGFSGGPLMNTGGQMVGLTNLSFGRGMGVALGIPILTHVVELILTQGHVKRGYLGISTQSAPLSETLRQNLDISQEHGLILLQVANGSPAEQGGLLMGDILLTLGGQAVEDADTLRRQLRNLSAGQAVTLGLARGGRRQELTVTLGAQE